MRKEIEVKAKLRDRETIVNKLKELGCAFSEPVEQHDTIFVDDNYGPFAEFQPEKNLLRVRETKGKAFLTLKQPKSVQMDSIERETEVSDPKEAKEMLLLMGYHAAAQVHKTRTKSNYNGWEICLDEVEGLGSFIEAEKITEDVDAAPVLKELFDFLKSLGINEEDRVHDGYDTLVYLKEHKK